MYVRMLCSVCRMQFLVQAGIVKKPPKWMAVVEAFPPLPTPPVYNTKTEEIVYEEEDQHRVSVTNNNAMESLVLLLHLKFCVCACLRIISENFSSTYKL